MTGGPISRVSDRLGRVVAWFFLAAVALSVLEVVMRYVFGMPSSWSNPTVTTLCAIGFAIGGAYAMVHDQHIRITVFADARRPATRRVLLIAGLCIGLFYLAGFAYGLWIQAEEAVWRFGPQGWRPELTPGPPNWPLPAIGKSVLLLATLLFLGVVAERVVAAFRARD